MSQLSILVKRKATEANIQSGSDMDNGRVYTEPLFTQVPPLSQPRPSLVSTRRKAIVVSSSDSDEDIVGLEPPFTQVPLLLQPCIVSTAAKRKATEADLVSGSEPDESDPENDGMQVLNTAMISKVMKLVTSTQGSRTTDAARFFICGTRACANYSTRCLSALSLPMLRCLQRRTGRLESRKKVTGSLVLDNFFLAY